MDTQRMTTTENAAAPTIRALVSDLFTDYRLHSENAKTLVRLIGSTCECFNTEAEDDDETTTCDCLTDNQYRADAQIQATLAAAAATAAQALTAVAQLNRDA